MWYAIVYVHSNFILLLKEAVVTDKVFARNHL